MRVVVQRSKAASVEVEGTCVGAISFGLVLLVGITHEDTEEDVIYCVDKIAGLRIFVDDQEKMNHSVQDVNGEILSISQFTLYGDVRKGRRPNFMAAAKPEKAYLLYERFNEKLKKKGLKVETGRFGEMMKVELINDGPVTLIVDSEAR